MTYGQMTEDCVRSHIHDPTQEIRYHQYELRERKTEQGSNRVYNLHKYDEDNKEICAQSRFDDWMLYAKNLEKHEYKDDDSIFPALKIPKRNAKGVRPASSVKWGLGMHEGNITTLLNGVCIYF